MYSKLKALSIHIHLIYLVQFLPARNWQEIFIYLSRQKRILKMKLCKLLNMIADILDKHQQLGGEN